MALWHWKQGTIKAVVELVNNRYRFTIIDTVAGMRTLLKQGSCDTLPEAKKQALQYIEQERN